MLKSNRTFRALWSLIAVIGLRARVVFGRRMKCWKPGAESRQYRGAV